jgi:hypothetical protein
MLWDARMVTQVAERDEVAQTHAEQILTAAAVKQLREPGE